MTQAELANVLGLDPSALSRALSGQRNFKSLEIALIAQTLQISTQQLLATEREPISTAATASPRPTASPAVERARERVHEILQLDRLLADHGFAPGPYISIQPTGDTAPQAPGKPAGTESGQPAEQGHALAKRLRQEAGLGDDDLPYQLADLAQMLERQIGLDIAFEPLPSGLDGMSVCRPNGFRLALVSTGISATRQRFSLAHQIGHLIAGDAPELRIDEDLFARDAPEEHRANAFAASFLMPISALRAELRPGVDVSEELVAGLLGRFGVSLDALAFQLHQTDLVDAATRDRIRALSSDRIALRSGRTTDLQARNERRAPGNLLRRATEAYVAGRLSVRSLARLLVVEPEELLDELSPPNRRPRDRATDGTVPAL